MAKHICHLTPKELKKLEELQKYWKGEDKPPKPLEEPKKKHKQFLLF